MYSFVKNTLVIYFPLKNLICLIWARYINFSFVSLCLAYSFPSFYFKLFCTLKFWCVSSKMPIVETKSPWKWAPLLSLWLTSLFKTLSPLLSHTFPSRLRSIKEKKKGDWNWAEHFGALLGKKLLCSPCFLFVAKEFTLLVNSFLVYSLFFTFILFFSPSLLFSLSFKEQAHKRLLLGKWGDAETKEKEKLRKAMTIIQQ